MTVLLQKALIPESYSQEQPVSEQIFGNDIKQQYIGLKHAANLFAERCQIHKNHIQEIERRHMEAQEKLFGVKINNSSDKSNLNVVQSILENMDIDTNIVYILMLYKEISNEQRSSLFTDQISAVVNKHAVIKDGNFKNVDWATIIQIAQTKKDDPLQESFAIARFSNEIETQLKDAGFTFMDKYKISITKKHG